MNKKVKYIAFVCVLFVGLSESDAQFRGSNLAEFQLGNIPGVEPKDQSSLYDQLNLSYRYKKLSLSTRVEYYSLSSNQESDYTKLSQYKVNYNSKWLTLDVGHFYSAFGRGLLMRNYEIPSSIYEDRSYRVRHGFYKDMHGLSAKFKSKYVNVKFLRGTVLTVDLPPTLDNKERRTDLVEGAEIDGNYKNQTLGLIVMRHHNGGNKSNYVSTYYNGNLNNFTIYGELAQRIDSSENAFNFSEDESFGGYVGLNYNKNSFGISLEYKSYNNFGIGNGVNDPPTLVKEHSSRFLNRSTHIPLLFNENGIQAEVFYMFPNGNMLTVNHATSQNKLATETYIFREYYVDLSAYIGEKILTRSFFDYSIDPLTNEPARYTAGVSADVEHSKLSSTFDIEAQYIQREISAAEEIQNILFAYTLSKSTKFSFSALFELSNDPFLLEDGKSSIIYPSVTASYWFGTKNKLTAFYGKRRGGPACTSGVCYDVLDFEGLELRLNTRF